MSTKKKYVKKPKKSRLNTFTYQEPFGISGVGDNIPAPISLTRTVQLPDSTVVGISQPAFSRLIEIGADATTPLSATFHKRTYTPASYVLRGGVRSMRDPPSYDGIRTWQEIGFNPLWEPITLDYPPEEVNKTRSAATIKFSNKVREAMMEVSGPTFIGEIRETLELVRRPGVAIKRQFDNYMRRCTRRIKKNPRPTNPNRLEAWHKWFVDAYLSFTYGIQPLQKDIEGGISALRRLTRPAKLNVYASAKGEPESFAWAETWGRYQYVGERRHTCSVRINGTIRAEKIMPVATLDRLSQLLGFSWAETIPTAYNLIPFSFVIDYFSNLNGVLSAGYASSAYVNWASTTQRLRATEHVTIQAISVPSPPGGGYGMEVTTVYMDRRIRGGSGYTKTTISRIHGFPAVRLYTEFPSTKQWFNLAALSSAILKLNKLWGQ